MTKYFKIPFLIIYSFFIFFFYFKDLGLENINEDQLRWYDRTVNFFQALNNKNFSETYQQYHPGVTLIYLIKLGMVSFETTQGIIINNFRDVPSNLFPSFNFHTKFYLVIATLIITFFLAFLIKEIYGKFIAITFLLILTFDTYFIGLTRNLHMDSILAVLISASIVSFYRYFQTSSSKYLIMTFIISGIGLLTKSVFGIGLLFQFLIAIYFSLNGAFKPKLKPLKIYFLSLFLSFLVFTALFPSMWVGPIDTLYKIYIQGALNTGLGGEDNFMHYVNNYELPDPGYKFYGHVLTFRTSPTIIFTIIFLIFFYLYSFYKNRRISFKKDSLIFILFIFTIVYLAIITYSTKKTDRYISILLPPLAIIIAFYVKDLWQKISLNYLKGILIFFGLITILINYLIHPFYFAYYNPIFGGVTEAQKRIYINQGGLMYLDIVKEINKYPNYKISAINHEEIFYTSNLPIEPIGHFNFLERNYIKILPLQRGNNFIDKSVKTDSIFLLGEEFWRFYKD